MAGVLLGRGLDRGALVGGDNLVAATARLGDARLLGRLLATGVPVNPTHGIHPLWAARHSRRENAEKVAALFAAGADPNARVARGGSTLLVHACLHAEMEWIRRLLAAGADPTRADLEGLTPARAAAISGDAAVWRELEGWGVRAEAPSVAEIERHLILKRALYSELHELVKWAARHAGWRIPGMSVRARTGELTLRYALDFEGARVSADLVFFGGGGDGDGDTAGSAPRISLVLLNAEGTQVLADFLPPARDVDAKVLRGHLGVAFSRLGEEAARRRSLSGAGGASAHRSATEGSKKGFDGAAHAEAFTFAPWNPERDEALATLRLESGATVEEVAQAYRRLAKRFHPDARREIGDDEMKRINSAYAVLRK